MSASPASLLRFAATLLATLIVGSSAIWGACALWFQAPGGRVRKSLSVLLWAAFSLILMFTFWQGRTANGILTFTVAFGALLVWWQRIAPSNDRIWADDVARMTTGTVEGNRVALRNVRNFDWRSNTDYTQRWETRERGLDRLQPVAMSMSCWTGPAIAHMLISFGFDDGEHIVFSVEIRRERIETFSEIGGFFKEFELSIIACDERDVVRVRTNVRGEDDYLYRIRMPVADMRALFLAYVGQANSLVLTPRF